MGSILAVQGRCPVDFRVSLDVVARPVLVAALGLAGVSSRRLDGLDASRARA